MDALAGLDADQRAAVTAPTGVVVVRAGAGSGKTTVLTRRMAWRASTGSADAERMLAITFTRQAATEMRSRLARFDLDGSPVIGTFHAVARRLMHQRLTDTGRPIPVIASNRSSIMSACMGEDVRRTGTTDMLALVDWAQSHALGPDEAVSRATREGRNIPVPAERAVRLLGEFERAKKKRGVVDLNDLLLFVLAEAERDPRFVESIRFQHRHISVDEAQDMNRLQYGFLRLLMGKEPDAFLVGDPNQAIYGFNGADRSLFDELPGVPGGVHVVSLPSNYRCTPDIVEFAVSALGTDGQTADSRSVREPGVPVRLERCKDGDDELDRVWRAIDRARGSGLEWGQIAVLVRVNALADAVRSHLESRRVPVRTALSGGAWSRAIATAAELTGRRELATWSADILDSGEYDKDEPEWRVAMLVREYLDANRAITVDGRGFSSWVATSAEVAETPGVEVLTFHSAKGRQWPVVVVAGAERGMLPHRGARSAEQRHEEARLAYVAFTRAADELVVCWTDQRKGRRTGPSPLLPHLTPKAPARAPMPEEIRARARGAVVADPVASALEEWRVRRARRARIAPEGVLSARQCKQLLARRPASAAEIAEIVDPAFARRYAEELVAILTADAGPA